MHLTRLTIRDLRSIGQFDLELAPDECAGWHVILGNNGSGKSTVVRALATALMGYPSAEASRQEWTTWVRNGKTEGRTEVALVAHPSDDWRGRGNTPAQPELSIKALVHLVGGRGNGNPHATIDYQCPQGQRTLWQSGNGWFSASFGPFRRFTGGDPQMAKLYYSHPRLAAHLSALGEHVALSESLVWLRQLHAEGLDGNADAESDKNSVVRFVNQANLLPHEVRVANVSSSRVTMQTSDGEVDIEEMSDGYRSTLSLTLELLRLMSTTMPGGLRVEPNGTVRLPGVVVIDEIDTHLHPEWQQRIGEWFVDRFPETQFIVTTHSPIICRTAARGSVWMLPAPGDAGAAYRVEGTPLARLVNGNILDAYSTDLFGEDVTRSARSREHLARLAELNRDRFARDLSDAETQELDRLRATFPTNPNATAQQ